MRRFAPQLFAQVFGIGLVLFSVSTSLAQRQGSTATSSPQPVQNREWGRGGTREQVNFVQYQRELERAKLAMRTDFRNLQVVNNQLMLRVFKPTATKITNTEIRTQLGEIGKLAERLRLNFGFSKTKPALANELTLKPGLDRLDDAVMSFVQNPLFQQPRVYDIDLASRAEKDLGDILELVDVLRKLTKD